MIALCRPISALLATPVQSAFPTLRGRQGDWGQSNAIGIVCLRLPHLGLLPAIPLPLDRNAPIFHQICPSDVPLLVYSLSLARRGVARQALAICRRHGDMQVHDKEPRPRRLLTSLTLSFLSFSCTPQAATSPRATTIRPQGKFPRC